MSASQVMPYFVKPSINLPSDDKIKSYEIIHSQLQPLLADESDLILKMSTINCILKSNMPYFYWVGFYIVRNDRLEVGPYQGTLGCLQIPFTKGVCGKAAREKETQLIIDCNALQHGTEHIACDPNSQSEIVVPVFDSHNNLIAVLDVDSTLTQSFCDIDKENLEKIVALYFQ